MKVTCVNATDINRPDAVQCAAKGGQVVSVVRDCAKPGGCELRVPKAVQVTVNAQPRAATPGIPIQARPRPTLKQAASFVEAMIKGKRVSLDVIQSRQAICGACDKIKKTPAGEMWCGMCGCPVPMDVKKIQNLAAYEENLPKWGCKHPQRSEGKGWPTTIASKQQIIDAGGAYTH